MKDPEAARRRTLELFTLLGELDGSEQVVMPVLLDAVMIVQAYRGAPPGFAFAELTGSGDTLIRELRSRSASARQSLQRGPESSWAVIARLSHFTFRAWGDRVEQPGSGRRLDNLRALYRPETAKPRTGHSWCSQYHRPPEDVRVNRR
ncbi:MAG: hypothetical protein JWN69_2074 [Alphaproteobacteria bacterium]|nr:hypothetical protein [Alphaproteobacteria bacterium]